MSARPDATEVDAVDVLVVGAGPAGLGAAITLGRYGVSTLLVERRTVPSTLPRATVLSTRSMELLRSWGLEAEIRSGGVDADVVLWETPTLVDVAAGCPHPVGYPTRAQAELISPTAPAVVPQDHLEAVLRRHVRSTSVRFELGAEVVAVEEGAGAVRAEVVDATGAVRTVIAHHLVAADGAHSPIRSMLGVEMEERGGVYGGVQVLFRAPLWPLVGEHRYALYWVTTPAAPGLFLPAGPSDRWVYGPGLPADDERAPGVDPHRLSEAIRLGAGVDVAVRIERIGAFDSVGQLAERFRVGRSFLVGDAAHRVTPRGGTGLNTALHSGHDLGWKLAWTHRGWADPDLLDTYEAERRVVAEHNVVRSTDPDGSRRLALDELQVDLAGRIAHTWIDTVAGRRSTLDLLGPGWTRFTGPAHVAHPAPTTAPVPVVERRLDALTAIRLGIESGGSLLVRPDGVPASARSLRPTVTA